MKEKGKISSTAIKDLLKNVDKPQFFQNLIAISIRDYFLKKRTLKEYKDKILTYFFSVYGGKNEIFVY